TVRDVEHFSHYGATAQGEGQYERQPLHAYGKRKLSKRLPGVGGACRRRR
ncbi:hypothetical protein COCMIDRAFT_81316, partial [Bipolaris oryzae ATCC 44560]